MFFGIDIRKYLGDGPLRIDQKRGAHNAHGRFAKERFLLPNAILFGQLVTLIGQQREGQVLFGLEFGLILHRIGAGSQNNGVSRFKLGGIITDSLRLNRSARGHGFGEEVENHPLAPIIRQSNQTALIICHFKIWRYSIFG